MPNVQRITRRTHEEASRSVIVYLAHHQPPNPSVLAQLDHTVKLARESDNGHAIGSTLAKVGAKDDEMYAIVGLREARQETARRRRGATRERGD